MNVELYIANQLCDLDKKDLGIRFKRLLYNPKEMSIKDAQKSYSITLPATPRNNEILQHKNVEETVGKFSLYPDARLYVNNRLIFEGKFRLSEITRTSYKGNLGVPAPLTAKDVFGERKMNDVDEWLIPFDGERSLETYNKREDAEVIFPLVLYGLFPNVGTSSNLQITAANPFKLIDFPPSFNCLQMLRHIFKSAKYNLGGTAFDDERLKNLYVSYKNPEDYPLPFEPKTIGFSGKWTNWKDGNAPETRAIRKNHSYDGDEKINDQQFIACNLFRCDRMELTSEPDDDGHHMTVRDNNQVVYTVPADGLYKISLNATIALYTNGTNGRTDVNSSIDGSDYKLITYRHSGYDGLHRCFTNTACELKLIRHQDEEYDLAETTMDNVFGRKNQDQSVGDAGSVYPEPGYVNFVDVAQNPNLLCGFSWGRVTYDNRMWNASWEPVPNYCNPLVNYDLTYNSDSERRKLCQALAIKHGSSWSKYSGNTETAEALEKRYSAVYSPGYVFGDGTPTETYKVDMSYEKGYYKTQAKADIQLAANDERDFGKLPYRGSGSIQQVVWLKAGEHISLIAMQDMAKRNDWIRQDITFDWSVEPFVKEHTWIAIDDATKNSDPKKPMYWDKDLGESKGQIDLAKFLPQEVKIDDWISNFCKAFNLQLIYKGGNKFELDVRNKGWVRTTSQIIDLDSKANVGLVTNESLALPRSYNLGFTVDTSEAGYYRSLKSEAGINDGQTGGGIFYTGSDDNSEVEQKSNFSYCWYETIKIENDSDKYLVPIISDREAWDGSQSYADIKDKRYYNLAQRFWFRHKTKSVRIHDVFQDIAIVSDQYNGNQKLWLNYEDKPDSIMRNYFMLMANDRAYTVVECQLTAEEYDLLDKACVRFNGDLYNVVEADGYDPSGQNKTKLKLLKRI